jgi:hypothetical protein
MKRTISTSLSASGYSWQGAQARGLVTIVCLWGQRPRTHDAWHLLKRGSGRNITAEEKDVAKGRHADRWGLPQRQRGRSLAANARATDRRG